MDFPDGLQQEYACFLISMRDFYDDPTWEDPLVIIPMLLNAKNAVTNGAVGGGMPLNSIAPALQGLGLCAITTMEPHIGNPDFYPVKVNNLDGYYIQRCAKAIFTYEIRQKEYHTICAPYHVVRCLAEHVTWHSCFIAKTGVVC